MKISLNIILFLSLFISCVPQHNDTLEFEKDLYSPAYSSNFKIEGSDDSDNVLISVYNPWQGAENVSSQFLIQRDTIGNENFNGQILKGNADRIICMSSTHIAMLDALGANDKIIGVSGMQYISNPFIRANEDKIPDIGYEGNIDYETLIATNPDLVLLFSVNGSSTMEPKLKELGIPFLYIGDYVEEDPLGKVEWIIPLAEVIGKRNEGIEKFKEIATRYESLKEKISLDTLQRPKVMVNAPFLDSWFMPSTESYVARMIKDAGGDYIYRKNTGNSSQPVDIEEALKLVSETDYWINIGSINTKKELESTLPKFINTQCVREGRIYNNNRLTSSGGGNDCYESGVVKPDLVLRDMVKIFHPELVDEEFTYYHQLK